jgi:hypothetical protein
MASRWSALLILLLAPLAVRAQEPVRVLIIDGNGAGGPAKGGDAYYVEAVLKSVKGYAPAVKGIAELETADLKQYPVVFLLNVPELSEPALKNLESNVKSGGGVAFFLGNKVKPAHYNRRLYRKGEGLFPVELANRPTDPPDEKQKNKEKSDVDRPTIYLRDPRHPVCTDLADGRDLFILLALRRHYPIVRPKAGLPASVHELIALPNTGDLEEFKQEAQQLNRLIPASGDQHKDFQAGLERYQWAVRQVLVFGKKACELGDALDAMLEDRGDPKDPEKPDLTEFWNKKEVKDLRQRVAVLRDKARYGDPLVLAAPYGKGRVVVCTTSAGGDWNDWAGGLAAPTFVILTANIAQYLSGGDAPPKEKSRP